MMLNIHEYDLSLSWTLTQTERAMNLINHPRILAKVFDVPIEINESH